MLDFLNRKAPAAPVDDGLADELAGMLEGKIATEDPASPDFDPAHGFDRPVAAQADVPGRIADTLAGALSYHRQEVERLEDEIETIEWRAEDAVKARQAVLEHHRTAVTIWSAAEDARCAAWSEPEVSVQPEPEAHG